VEKEIEEIVGKCRGIALYLIGDEKTPYPQSLGEIARKYNVEFKFLDEGSSYFNRVIELVGRVLGVCYGIMDVDECVRLGEEIAEISRRRREEWVKKK